MSHLTHDPLTPAQHTLLTLIETQHFVMSIRDQTSTPKGNDVRFLQEAGYIQPHPHHVGQKVEDNTYGWTRTAKPL